MGESRVVPCTETATAGVLLYPLPLANLTRQVACRVLSVALWGCHYCTLLRVSCLVSDHE